MPLSVSSPDGNIQLEFLTGSFGRPGYTVAYKNSTVIDTSYLGFYFQNTDNLDHFLSPVSSEIKTVDETWEPVWGEDAKVRNHYNELTLHLEEGADRAAKMDIIFRVYDDGLGFRYHIPAQAGMPDSVLITDEVTDFKLTGDHDCWWIPGDWDIYEHLYTHSKLSEIDAAAKRNNPNLAQTYIPDSLAVNTPVTMRTAEGLHLSFHEANLTDYAGMTLHVDQESFTLYSKLVAWPDGIKVRAKLPMLSPWRTIQIEEEAKDLIASHMIENLNEPNKLDDISYIKPTKYVGIWWDMHMGTKTWDKASGRHGATTAYAKELIDFASENNIGGILIEGWNTGWENWIGPTRPDKPFDFVTPYDDFDLEEVVRYGNEKGVDLISHHETSSCVAAYDEQLDTAYQQLERLGIHAVKTGYVGKINPKGIYHHSQYMVRHYRKVLETAAKHNVMVDAHEPIKATGLRRTYPNMVSREGLRGQEFNAWGKEGGNHVDHLATVAFTRMLAGPIDYTPGLFDMTMEWREPNPARAKSTLAHQLALYVVIYSPVQMVPDLVKNYKGHSAFQFIRDVAVDWEQTRVLDGEVGDYVVIARQAKGTENWFVGGIGDEEARDYTLDFSFLPKGKTYTAVIYKDADDAHWETNPKAYTVDVNEVISASSIPVRMAAGGGFAVSLVPQ